MEPPESSRARPGRVHRRYLQLRSVLFDRVTDLPAFPALLDPLRRLLDDRRSVGVLHLEIVNLELVESLYGWQVFDRILARVARELRESVGRELPPGTLLGLDRVAGDRFAAFVPEDRPGGEVRRKFLAELTTRICDRLDGVFRRDEFAGLSPNLEFRAGYALLSLNPFYRFERRVYSAIEEARSLHERRDLRREHVLGEELRRIIDDAALRTLFQPVVDLGSREILGYEALSRGPKDSPLEMPRTLFAISDRCGVLADLDRACRDAALLACAQTKPRGRIFLNVWPASLKDVGAEPDHWPAPLRRLANAPHDLVLEFPERAAEDDPDGFVATLGCLKRCGFGVALDDVGTGFASQAILEKIRPDYLKLDVSLVREIHRNLIKQEILHSLVRIAKRMGASVIAEGIETEEEAKALREAGAQYGQGYLYAQPAPRIGELRDRPRKDTGH